MGAGKRAIRIAFGKNHPIHRGNQNAQAIVELALILPILLVLIVGALEFGRLWSTKIMLTNAAREGAYYLSTHRTTSSTCDATCVSGTKQSVINDAQDAGTALSTSDITAVISADTNFTGAYKAVVTAQTTISNLLILGFLGNADHTLTLHSTVEMMIQ
jgi:Flp pilus assembly protein TadG